MRRSHDPTSGSLARASRSSRRSASRARTPALSGWAPGSRDADLLSDVLRTVRLTGALFFLVDARSPWVEEVPATTAFSKVLLPEAQHLISYHIVTKGSCWGVLTDGEGPSVHLEAGDILVIPHGHPYAMSSPRGLRAAYSPEDILAFFRGMASGELPSVVTEGGRGRERLQVLCGFLGCDVRPFNPVLTALPRSCISAVPRRLGTIVWGPSSSSPFARSRSGGRAGDAPCSD